MELPPSFAGLSTIANTDSFHMAPVRMIHARVQSDEPKWNATNNFFGSKYGGNTTEGQHLSLLDTVNTASVEGALMYVQAECINYNTRSAENRCWRKNNATYVVFYDIIMVQTNETIATFDAEYGPMLPMDGGQVTPLNASGVFPPTALQMNGVNSTNNIGPFVGGEPKDTDRRAPYPNTWWYSFPNSCPLKTWSTKTTACRETSRRGLCEFGVMPDGIKCTFNYRVLGYLPLDDLVGITSLPSKNNADIMYTKFAEYCKDGGVEFNATEAGVWSEGLDFWKDPQKSEANAARTQKMLDAYNALLTGTLKSPQVTAATVANFKPLPTVADLVAVNPECYKHVKACAKNTFGCKRSLYGQICTECTSAEEGCVAAPSGFVFPTLSKTMPSVARNETVPVTTNGTETTPTPTPTPTSGSAKAMMVTALTLAATCLATIALS